MSNPYQIRYDVLNMAKAMLDKQYDMQMELEAYNKYIPKAITPEEIKAQADKLYEFVTDKKE
jgi:hypothetical protein